MQNFTKKYTPKLENFTKKQNKLWNIRIISIQVFKDINRQHLEKQLLQEKCESVNVAHIAFLCFLCNRYH